MQLASYILDNAELTFLELLAGVVTLSVCSIAAMFLEKFAFRNFCGMFHRDTAFGPLRKWNKEQREHVFF